MVTVLKGAAFPAPGVPTTSTLVPTGPAVRGVTGVVAGTKRPGAVITAVLAIGMAARIADNVSTVMMTVVYVFLFTCIFSISPFY